MINVIVLGVGNRGKIYGSKLALFNDVNIVAICDKYQEKLDRVRNDWNVPSNMCFLDENDLWAQGKIADAIVIASQDRDHYAHAIKALELGYHIMMEKPVSPNLEECLHIESLAKEKDLKVIVCHVLRYTKYYKKIKEILNSGIIGDIKVIRHSENISYWHFSHSYVRGNWRNENTTSPMLLAKCCHDMDLMYWYAGSKAKSVTSYGELSHFTRENAPADSADRCSDCSLKSTCIYEAELQYLGRNNGIKKEKKMFKWGTYAFSTSGTRQDIKCKLKTGNYGRCVFKCDNNVVDNQVVNIEFENNIKVSFAVNAFNQDNYRSTHICGTMGEIIADDRGSIIKLKVFGEGTRKIVVNVLPILSEHLGGDYAIAETFVKILKGQCPEGATYISDTIESHKIVFAAEKSRLSGGELVRLS